MKVDYKIAEEIKSKGFSVAKCNMNDESPDEWVLFGVWFYLRTDYYVDLDWRIGKYYFYVESGKEDVKAKEPKNKSLDTYSAVDFLSQNLLKNFELLNTIAKSVHSDGLYTSEDISIVSLFDIDDNKAVLYWIVDEQGDDTVYCICNRDLPLIMFSPFANREKLIKEAKHRGLEVVKEKPFWAAAADDILEDKVVGFEEIDFLF